MFKLMLHDLMRCRVAFLIWWGFCVLLTVSGGIYVRNWMPTPGHFMHILWLSSYAILAVQVGMLFLSGHPGDRFSFFQAKPVNSGNLFSTRLLLVFAALLLPFYFAALTPLLMVEATWDTFGAFTLWFLATHIIVLSVMIFFAAMGGKLSAYLARFLYLLPLSFLLGVLYNEVRWNFRSQFSVLYPQVVEGIWTACCYLIASILLIVFARKWFQGRNCWPSSIIPILTASVLVFFATWPTFLQKYEGIRHPLPEEIMDASGLSYTAGRGQHHGYDVQTNHFKGHSIGGQSAAPYLTTSEEIYWFIMGELDVTGLDPERAYSASMISAEWTSADGDTLVYDPPRGTEEIRRNYQSTFGPPVTQARFDALLKPGSKKTKETNGAQIMLFGAWTSEYKKFNTTPGRLVLKIQVNFFTHDLGARFPLVPTSQRSRTEGHFQISVVNRGPEKLRTHIEALSSAKRFSNTYGDAWEIVNRGFIYDPVNHVRFRGFTNGSGGNKSLYGLVKSRNDKTYTNNFTYEEDKTAGFNPDHPLEWVWIKPRYLGSKTVEVVIEDFSLVTERSLDPRFIR